MNLAQNVNLAMNANVLKLSFFAEKANALGAIVLCTQTVHRRHSHPLFSIVVSIFWSLANRTKPLFANKIVEGVVWRTFGRLSKFIE